MNFLTFVLDGYIVEEGVDSSSVSFHLDNKYYSADVRCHAIQYESPSIFKVDEEGWPFTDAQAIVLYVTTEKDAESAVTLLKLFHEKDIEVISFLSFSLSLFLSPLSLSHSSLSLSLAL
jgi:hypothetical protein